MGNLTTTDYVEGAIALGLLWYGFKRASGIAKWGLIGVGAYLAYGVYQDY